MIFSIYLNCSIFYLLKSMKLSVKRISSYEEWERANSLIKEAFFTHCDYIPKNNLIVLIKNEAIVGSFELTLKENFAEVNHLTIESSQRGKGLGGKFLKKIIKYLKYKKIKSIEFVSPKNRKEFYQKNGFKINYEKNEYFYFKLKL